MRLRERAAGHRQRQLDVVRRVGRDEVDRAVRDAGQERERIADAQLQAGRIEPPRPARVRGAEVGQLRAGPIALRGEVADHRLVDRGPAGIEFDADGPSWPAGDGRSQERAAHPGERVQDQLTGPAEELDEAGHQAWRLVGAVGLACGMAELGRVGRREDRLGEVQPFLTRQLVELIGRMGLAACVGHGRKGSGGHV